MRIISKLWLFTLVGATSLCACQAGNGGGRNHENVRYSAAINSGGAKKVVEHVPVPMPGQRMVVDAQDTKVLVEGTKAIDEANKKAIKQPSSKKYINSIMTFDYMEGALYQIYTAPLSVTDVQFQNNEHIIAVGAGDTLRWQVSKTYSGMGATRKEHLLIKPLEDELDNSLVVTTDLRTYHLLLHSTPKTYMASVTWRYPDAEDDMVARFDGEIPTEGNLDIAGVDINNLNFNYYVKLKKGVMPAWYPKMVFNDGRKTYIKFSVHTQDAPTLFVGDGSVQQVVNYRVQGNYYIVDKVFQHAQLRGGIDNKTIIQIEMRKRR